MTGKSKKGDVTALRSKIDAIDNRVIDLLNRRASLAQAIGELKARAKLPAYVPERERQVLDRLVERSQGPLPAKSLRLIYKEIISASLALESPLKVAFVGPEASLNHAAGKRHFGLSAQLRVCRSIAEVFSEVERGASDYGVVPVESTTLGVEHQTLERFLGSDLQIGSEVCMEVRYELLTRHGTLRGLQKIYAHPQTLEPCTPWVQQNLPGVTIEPTDSTVQAAQAALDSRFGVLVADRLAASWYGLRVAASDLQTAGGHHSRFWVIGHHAAKPSSADRTSLLFAVRQDAPGLLYKALQTFARNTINLTRIESRPSRRRDWDYLFFVDLDGHRDDARVATAIESLAQSTVFLQILGSYPRGVPRGREKSKEAP